MVTIEIGGLQATAQGSFWTSGDEPLLRMLRQDTTIEAAHDYSSFPELDLAKTAISRYGGAIVREVTPSFVDGRLY